MSIGILGGTFDPPHKAHVEISNRAIEQYDLSQIYFVPSKNPWQKDVSTTYIDRFNMTSLLVQDFNNIEVSNIEQLNENKTYTVDTLKKLSIPKDELYFILGADVAIDIKTWNRYEELEKLTNFLIAPRNHINEKLLYELFPFEYSLIEGEELDISSSNIRKSYENGVNLNSIIPEEVLNYICAFMINIKLFKFENIYKP